MEPSRATVNIDPQSKAGIERRLHTRFPIPRCHIFSSGERMHLLNLGRSGMAFESYGRCSFSRSENHHFILDDHRSSIEVVGRVSWVSSSWVDDENIPGTGLIQTVGVSFQEVVSPYRVGLWRAIETSVLSGDTGCVMPVPLAETPIDRSRPIAVMNQPLDGSTSPSRFVTVEGVLNDAESVARLKINDAEATIDGPRFSARVHLSHEVNYLWAVLSHWNSTTSRCFLGKVLRQLDNCKESSSTIDIDELEVTRVDRAAAVIPIPSGDTR